MLYRLTWHILSNLEHQTPATILIRATQTTMFFLSILLTRHFSIQTLTNYLFSLIYIFHFILSHSRSLFPPSPLFFQSQLKSGVVLDVALTEGSLRSPGAALIPRYIYQSMLVQSCTGILEYYFDLEGRVNIINIHFLDFNLFDGST